MSTASEMPPARRRPIAGMPAAKPTPTTSDTPSAHGAGFPSPDVPGSRDVVPRPALPPSTAPAGAQRSDDYGVTRLVNFRLPVDLHDRCKALVRDVEVLYPRLRHPSVTELLIALLEEGPTDAAAAADLIRRKRAAEHGVER